MIRHLFPTVVFQRNLLNPNLGEERSFSDEYIKMLKDEMDAMRRRDPIGRKISNAYTGWQSNDGVDNNPIFQKLMNRIQQTFMDEVWPYYGCSQDLKYQMGNCWANINDRDAWNKPHLHNGCWYSGVFYIHADGDEGNFIGINTDPKVVSDMPHSNRQQEAWEFEPKSGELILFPSGMMHMVAPNISDKDRYSVSFNMAYHMTTPESRMGNPPKGWHPDENCFELDENAGLVKINTPLLDFNEE